MAVEMAIRASATPRPSLPPPKLSLKPPKFRPTSVSLPTSTTISLLGLFTSPIEAKAFSLSKDQIVSSLTEERTMQQVGSTVFDGTAHVLESVLNAVKPGIDAALPIGKQAGEQALKIASPARLPKKQSMALGLTYRLYSVLQRLVYKVFCLLKLNTLTERSIWSQTVADAAGQTTEAVEEAKPLASSTIQTISSADPIVIAGTAGALFLAYLLLPPIWSALSFSLRVRGYQDIRPEKDKDKAGIPRLPSSAESKMIAIPLEELPNKLRGLVRNAKKVEAEIAALKISYLKRVNKGSSIVILDS
ncbi:hypothetical protein ACFX13_040008 [Malus domestica]